MPPRRCSERSRAAREKNDTTTAPLAKLRNDPLPTPAEALLEPAIAWIWSRGGSGTGETIIYTVLLLVSGMADNVLKPLMLGRGVDVPMPVILVGALGGMATGGIIGMFVGATLLALAWQVVTGWVDESPETNIPPGG